MSTIIFSTTEISGLSNPTYPSAAARKKYVDDQIAGVGAGTVGGHMTADIGSDFTYGISGLQFVSSQRISGGTITTNSFTLYGDTISGLALPEFPSAAASKKYVDDTIDALGVFDGTNYITSTNSISRFKQSSGTWDFASSQRISGGTVLSNTISSNSIHMYNYLPYGLSVVSLSPIDIDISGAKDNLITIDGYVNGYPYGAMHSICATYKAVPMDTNISYRVIYGYQTLSNSNYNVVALDSLKFINRVDSDYTGTITAATGIYAQNYIDQSAGSLIDLYGIYIWNAVNNSNIVTNNYGLYIYDIEKGINSNYSIYTGLGKVRFGDSLTVIGKISSQGISGGIGKFSSFIGPILSDIANSSNVRFRFPASSTAISRYYPSTSGRDYAYKHSANTSIHALSNTNIRVASVSSARCSGQWRTPVYNSLTAAGAASTKPFQIICTSGNAVGTWTWISIYNGSSYQWNLLTYAEP